MKLLAIQSFQINFSYRAPMLTYLILIYNLHRQKRGVPCSDRLEQVRRRISYKGSQQKLLCRWKSTPQNIVLRLNLTLVSSRNEVAIADLVMNTLVVVQFVPPKNNLYIKYVQFAKHIWSPVACCPNIWCSEGGKSGLTFHNKYRPGSKTLYLGYLILNTNRPPSPLPLLSKSKLK